MRITSIFVFIIVPLSSISYATSPTSVPWPVGSTDSLMNFTKTLMASYGDQVNGWGEFHAGIDIDSWTETPNCDDIRSVLDGDVVISNMYRFYADSAYQWTVITTEGTDRGRGFRDGCTFRSPLIFYLQLTIYFNSLDIMNV